MANIDDREPSCQIAPFPKVTKSTKKQKRMDNITLGFRLHYFKTIKMELLTRTIKNSPKIKTLVVNSSHWCNCSNKHAFVCHVPIKSEQDGTTRQTKQAITGKMQTFTACLILLCSVSSARLEPSAERSSLLHVFVVGLTDSSPHTVLVWGFRI